MRVFVTGATGYIGSAIVRELVDAGHQVTGLARSAESATALADAGAQAGSLRDGAAASDSVIHNAFTNVSPTTDFIAACQADAAAISALGAGLAGTGKPLVVTSGTGGVSVPGRAGWTGVHRLDAASLFRLALRTPPHISATSHRFSSRTSKKTITSSSRRSSGITPIV
jgi:nucleoside-diphosphate-sugar epimerase